MINDTKPWFEMVIPTIDDCFSVVIPHEISATLSFLREVGSILKFPDYYGENWNAFEECINDLSWIKEKNVVLIHNEMPKIPADQQIIYVDILKNAAESWGLDKDHILIVVFQSTPEPGGGGGDVGKALVKGGRG